MMTALDAVAKKAQPVFAPNLGAATAA